MPRNLKLEDLVLRCQQRCDLEGDDLISDAEWKGLISTAKGEMDSYLIDSGMRYFESYLNISSSSLDDAGDGGGSVELPPDHLSTLGVDYEYAANRWRMLPELMFQERNVFHGSGLSYALVYAHVGSELRLYPKPNSGQTYRLVYVPQSPDLSTAPDETLVDVVTPDGEDFIIEHVRVRALSKEGTDVVGAVAERGRAKDRLQIWAAKRSLLQPRRPQVQSGPLYADDFPDAGGWWNR